MNITAFFVAAIIPILVGFIYYHKKALGSSWMSLNGFTDEKVEGNNMLVTLLASYVLSVLLAFALSGIVNHQSGVFSLFMDDPENPLLKQVMAEKGAAFRTFGHGALHGFMATLTIALPIIGINALFEQRGWKYIWLHVGYWAITLMLMGGLICAWV